MPIRAFGMALTLWISASGSVPNQLMAILPPKANEISPMAGFSGASPSFGVRGFMRYENVALELSGEQIVGNTAVLYPLTLNFLLDLAKTMPIVPYGVIGGGLFLTLPSNAVGSKTISTLGLCYGAGLRYYFTPLFGLRLESKLYLSEIEAKGEQFQAIRKELVSFQSLNLGVILGIP